MIKQMPESNHGAEKRRFERVDISHEAQVLVLDAKGRKAGVLRQLARGGNPALADAGALPNPFIRGVETISELAIGYDALGQIGAAADNLRSQDHLQALTTLPRRLRDRRRLAKAC